MEPHITVVTLGVRDVQRSHRFYVEGLGWPATLYLPGEVLFVQVGHGLLLGCFDVERFAREAPVRPQSAASPPLSLGHLVDSEEAVGEALDQAAACGGSIATPASRRDWGGVSGYFTDPDGFLWEVAHNPGLTVASDGTVRFAGADGG